MEREGFDDLIDTSHNAPEEVHLKFSETVSSRFARFLVSFRPGFVLLWLIFECPSRRMRGSGSTRRPRSTPQLRSCERKSCGIVK